MPKWAGFPSALADCGQGPWQSLGTNLLRVKCQPRSCLHTSALGFLPGECVGQSWLEMLLAGAGTGLLCPCHLPALSPWRCQWLRHRVGWGCLLQVLGAGPHCRGADAGS